MTHREWKQTVAGAASIKVRGKQWYLVAVHSDHVVLERWSISGVVQVTPWLNGRGFLTTAELQKLGVI